MTNSPQGGSAGPPLCVDLDGTLTKGDSTVRMGWHLVLTRPWLALAIPYWDRQGRARLKEELARRVPPQAISWRYNRALIEWLQQQHTDGRRLILASGSNHRAVAAVARHVGLFDEFIASDAASNFAGAAKATGLAQRFGSFDYIGNSKKDVAVWNLSRECYLVTNSARLTKWLAGRVQFARIFPGDWRR